VEEGVEAGYGHGGLDTELRGRHDVGEICGRRRGSGLAQQQLGAVQRDLARCRTIPGEDDGCGS